MMTRATRQSGVEQPPRWRRIESANNKQDPIVTDQKEVVSNDTQQQLYGSYIFSVNEQEGKQQQYWQSGQEKLSGRLEQVDPNGDGPDQKKVMLTATSRTMFQTEPHGNKNIRGGRMEHSQSE
jgi:hypothetical protein